MPRLFGLTLLPTLRTTGIGGQLILWIVVKLPESAEGQGRNIVNLEVYLESGGLPFVR